MLYAQIESNMCHGKMKILRKIRATIKIVGDTEKVMFPFLYFFFKFKLFLKMVDLQCCVSFCCTEK